MTTEKVLLYHMNGKFFYFKQRNVPIFFFPWETSTIGGCFCGFVVLGAPQGSTGRRFLEKPVIEPGTPGLQGE